MKTVMAIIAVLVLTISVSDVSARCTQEDQDANNCPDVGGSCIPIQHCTENDVVSGDCCALWPEWDSYIGSMAYNAVETTYGPISTAGRTFDYPIHEVRAFVIGIGALRCDVVIVTSTGSDGRVYTNVLIGNCRAALLDLPTAE